MCLSKLLMAVIGSLALLAALTSSGVANAQDSDGDGFPDVFDNCKVIYNTVQDDTNADLIGNVCDPDYDQTGFVGMFDWAHLKRAFVSGVFDPDTDHTEPIGPSIDVSDYAVFLSFFNGPPGP